MTTYTSTGNSSHHTLVGGAEDNVVLDNGYRWVEIVNRGSFDLWITLDRGAANGTIVHPSVEGDGCYYLAPGAVRIVDDQWFGQGSPANSVRLFSTGATAYSVTGINTT